MESQTSILYSLSVSISGVFNLLNRNDLQKLVQDYTTKIPDVISINTFGM